MSDQELVDNMERVWRSIASLCGPFTELHWKTPTECPGWSAQDQLSHPVGSECRILERPGVRRDHHPSDEFHDLSRRFS
jgi:hypothetical protein